MKKYLLALVLVSVSGLIANAYISLRVTINQGQSLDLTTQYKVAASTQVRVLKGPASCSNASGDWVCTLNGSQSSAQIQLAIL